MLLTRPPLPPPKKEPSDLHVLGAPPAFVLSQDQTLHDSPPVAPRSQRSYNAGGLLQEQIVYNGCTHAMCEPGKSGLTPSLTFASLNLQFVKCCPRPRPSHRGTSYSTTRRLFAPRPNCEVHNWALCVGWEARSWCYHRNHPPVTAPFRGREPNSITADMAMSSEIASKMPIATIMLAPGGCAILTTSRERSSIGRASDS